MITYKVGDILKCHGNIAHCVSKDLRMSAGLARKMKSRFGGVGEMKKLKRRVGDIAVIRRNGRSIIGLITKERFWGKPSYTSIEHSLIKLRSYLTDVNQSSVAMPMIGCGLDGKDWNIVENLIENIFDGNFNVTIYKLPKPNDITFPFF